MIRPTAKRIALVGICAAILITAQVILAPLPNIELVSLLIIIYSVCLPKETPFVIAVFVLVEGLIYGFHMWWISYLYIWIILYGIVRLVGDMDSPAGWAVISGLYGLFFGALTAIPYFFTLGISGAAAYFLAGVVFDLLHCGGNFLVALLLYRPLRRAMDKANAQFAA